MPDDPNTINLLWGMPDLPAPVIDVFGPGGVVALREARRVMVQGRRPKPAGDASVIPGDVVAALLPQPKVARRFLMPDPAPGCLRHRRCAAPRASRVVEALKGGE
jgi:hypothetical protein